MEKEIEQVAQELYQKFHGHEVSLYYIRICPEWLAVAKHVLIREVRARIEELEFTKKEWARVTEQYLPATHLRITELTQQLKELSGGA